MLYLSSPCQAEGRHKEAICTKSYLHFVNESFITITVVKPDDAFSFLVAFTATEKLAASGVAVERNVLPDLALVAVGLHRSC